MYLKTGLLAVCLGVALFGTAGRAQAQSYQHIDRLAFRLQKQTAEMHREVHAHFRGTPDYIHLDRDVAAMERLARHIHEVAHRGGSIAHLRADVEELDRLFHHIEGVIGRLARTRQIGPVAFNHFQGVMSDVGRTLHHLRDDLDHMRGPNPGRPGGRQFPQPGFRIR